MGGTTHAAVTAAAVTPSSTPTRVPRVIAYTLRGYSTMDGLLGMASWGWPLGDGLLGMASWGWPAPRQAGRSGKSEGCAGPVEGRRRLRDLAALWGGGP